MPGHRSHIADRRELRADARHNRDRILDAAREAFAARGLDVPMAAIARRAGVGVATLYRRFPSRESLVTAVFSDQVAECAGAVDEALADPDPWHAFQTLVEKVCAMQVADKGFTAAFMTAFPEAIDFERMRRRAEQGLAEVVRRAKAAGRLRADFAIADLVVLMQANGGVAAMAGESAAVASRRLVAYMLQAFRAGSPAGNAAEDNAADNKAAERAVPLPPPAPLRLVHALAPQT
ncbi:TetR/AcrR family transcriptional regulator [Nonomuraea sp. NPDC049309]|uniref:TetR/AcrR family transcriptional regulator n=1 Tax=Nonomuraea sp. NPDC049309 TaxID=3364350 RepID=UPI0037221FA1